MTRVIGIVCAGHSGQHFVGGNRHLHPGITKEKRHGYDQATVDSIRAITAEVEAVLHAG